MGKSTDITADGVKSCASCGKCSKSCPAHIDISEVLGIYEEYLSGDVRTLEKSDGMESSGKPVDCIECGACTAHCPCGLDVKELMRELAMMRSCGRLMKFPYNGKVCKELLSGQSTPAKKFFTHGRMPRTGILHLQWRQGITRSMTQPNLSYILIDTSPIWCLILVPRIRTL